MRSASSNNRRPPLWKVFLATAIILVGGAVMVHAWTGDSNRSDLPWHEHRELRGKPLTAIRMRDGTTRSLDGNQPHVIYLFSTSCTLCAAQRVHLARMLEAVPDSVVISASTEPPSKTGSYWKDVSDSLAAPVQIDPSWLSDLGYPDKPPILILTTKHGAVSELITGDVTAWTPRNLLKEWKRSGVWEFR